MTKDGSTKEAKTTQAIVALAIKAPDQVIIQPIAVPVPVSIVTPKQARMNQTQQEA